ncbi:MAG: hypothetical protein ACT4OL_07145 [Nitrospiraceae bacterium]
MSRKRATSGTGEKRATRVRSAKGIKNRIGGTPFLPAGLFLPASPFPLVALVPLVSRVARFPHITRRMCAEEAYA